MIDAGASHALFVSGLKFTMQGVAEIWQVPVTPVAVPEPGASLLIGLGSLITLGYARRRMKE